MSNRQKTRWEQMGDKICLWCNEGLIWWQVPADLKLKDIHPDLMFAIECLLFFPFYREETIKKMSEHKFTRKQGSHPGLCFSGGVDSLAAMMLMPDDTKLLYHKRDLPFRYNCNYGIIAKGLFRELGRRVYVVPSNSDIFRMVHGKVCGYSTDFCCGLQLILLADYLDLGYFSTGTILESAYLSGVGVKYLDLSKRENCIIWRDLFKRVGLPFYLPVASISEVITNKIAEESGLLDMTVSCYKGTNCGKCVKCYRKSLLNNKPIKITPEIQKGLDEKPLHFYATFSRYSMSNNLKWDRYTDGDFKWMDEYYPKAFELVPEKFREFNREQIEKHAKPMGEPYIIEQIDILKNNYPKKWLY